MTRQKNAGESGAMLKAVRQAYGESQVEFANRLGVARSVVAGCEGGERPLSAQLAAKLGNIAADKTLYKQAVRLWELAGVEVSKMAPSAIWASALDATKVKIPNDTRSMVLPNSKLAQKSEVGFYLACQTKLLPNPIASSYMIVAGTELRPFFAPGDVVVMDSDTVWSAEALTGELVLLLHKGALRCGWIRALGPIFTFNTPTEHGSMTSEAIEFRGGNTPDATTLIGRVVLWSHLQGGPAPRESFPEPGGVLERKRMPQAQEKKRK